MDTLILLLKNLSPSFDEPITFVFIVLILGYFLYNLIILIWGIGIKANGNIKQAIRILSPYNKNDIYEHYDSVKDEMLNISQLGNYWREFDECLLPMEEDRKVHNSFNPREFFTETNLLHNHCDQSFMNAIPPILTGLGILGTFIGLVWGLREFGLDSTEEMQMGVKTMMSGITIAFKTSVWGIGLSIVLSFIINQTFASVKKNYYNLLDILDELFILHTEEDYLKEIRDISTQQLTQLKNLSDDLVEPMEQAMTKAVSATIEPVLNELKTAIVKLSEFKQESSEKAIEKMVDMMMEKFAGATNDKMLSMGETMDKAASKMSEAVDRIEGLLGNMKETTSTQSQAIEHVIASLSAVGDTLSGFKTIGAEMNRQADVFSQMRSENLNMMERIKDVGEQTGTKIESLQNASTTFEESVQKLQAISSQQADVGNVFNNVVNSLSNLSGQLEKKLTLITEHGDKFSHNIKEMSSTLESMFVLQDGYKESANAINTSLEKFNSASTSIEESLNILNNSSEILNTGIEEYKGIMQEFLSDGNEINESMKLTAADAKSLWDTHSNAFKQLDNAISSGIIQYTQGVKDSLEDILGDFDSHMSKAVKLFAESIGELDGNLEAMNGTLEKFQNKHGDKE